MTPVSLRSDLARGVADDASFPVNGALDRTLSDDDLVAQARGASRRGDHHDALSIWEALEARSPFSPAAMIGMGSALRQLSRLDEADAVFVRAISGLVISFRLLSEYAWVAHDRKDWPEALRRWRAVRDAYPDQMDGYLRVAAALRESGRLDEADAAVAAALGRFPPSVHLLGESAWIAHRRRDWDAALSRWRAVRDAFPNHPSGGQGMGMALRESGRFDEADTVFEAAIEKFPDHAALRTEYAWVATRRRDWTDALRRWEVVADLFPGVAAAYHGAAQALRELGRLQDAEMVLTPAIRLFPRERAIFSIHASLATYRNDWPEARKRWTEVIDQFSDVPDGYLGAAGAATRMKRFSEADKILRDCLARFPNNLEARVEYARVAHQVQNWQESVSRWNEIRNTVPKSIKIDLGLAATLRAAGRFDEADAILRSIIEENPEEQDAWYEYALVADKRLNWAESHTRWSAFVAKFPNSLLAIKGLSAMLTETGRFQESSAILTDGLRIFPGNIDLEWQFAITATDSGAWKDAFRRWEDLRKRLPNHPGIREAIADAVWKAQIAKGLSTSEVEDQAGTTIEIPASLLQPVTHDESDDTEIRDLLMKFESLGDTCEFGMIQRRFGAEPVGLLRWASMSPHKLVQALEERFLGIGDAGQTSVFIRDSEYWVKDERYGMSGHTYTNAGSISMDIFNVQQCKRMKFLRSKMISDLTDGEKIFLYRCREGLSYEQANAIYKSMLKYNDNPRLLCVFFEAAGKPSGSVHRDEAGFLAGYIDRFSVVDINVDAWVSICKGAEALFLS